MKAFVLVGIFVAVFAGDAFALDVKAQNPTSIEEVSYRIAGVTATVDGADADDATTLSVTLAAGNHTLQTTFGSFVLSVDGSGNIMAAAGVPVSISGSTVTILNTVSFSPLKVKAVNNTSIQEVSHRLYSWSNYGLPANRTVDLANADDPSETNLSWQGSKTILGSAAATGATFAFLGMTPHQVFYLDSSMGRVALKIDASGNLQPNGAIASDQVSTAGDTVTFQNTTSFSPLKVKAVNNTSIQEVTHRIYNWTQYALPANRTVDLGGGDDPSETKLHWQGSKTILGSAAAAGATFAFSGMTPHQVFYLESTMGRVSLKIDSSGNLQPNGTIASDQVSTAGDTVTFQNTTSFSPLKVKAVNNTSIQEVTHRIYSWTQYSLRANRTVDLGGADDPSETKLHWQGSKTILGSAAAAGTSFAFAGMTPHQVLCLDSTFGRIFLEIDADGYLQPANSLAVDLVAISGDTVTIRNGFDQRLKVTADENIALSSVTYTFTSTAGTHLPANRTLDVQTLAGTATAAGTEFDMLGVPPHMWLSMHTSAGQASFRMLPNGTVEFGGLTVPDTATTGHLPIESGTNNLQLEILPANEPPVISAGGNITISATSQATTVLAGTATDADGDTLTYRWFQGGAVVAGPAQPSGSSCSLALSSVATLPFGFHTFLLEVSDGTATVTDQVVVTVVNCPPTGAPNGGGVFELGPNSDVVLGATAADIDGNTLTYEWRLVTGTGTTVLDDGTVSPPVGGNPVAIPAHTVPTADLGAGVHVIELAVDDGVNEEQVVAFDLEVTEADAPTLNPKASKTILWPPNHTMVAIQVQANAADDCCGTPTLAVTITSNEPAEYDGDGNFIPDHTAPVINQSTGVITFSLRSERSGKGDGRAYTVTVTATDTAGNVSVEPVTIRAPHSRKKN